MKSLIDLGAKQLSVDDIRQLFPDEWWHEVFGYMKEPLPPVHFIDHSIAIDALSPGKGSWALIVHGDLHATGDLDFSTGDYKCSLLVVQGNVRARNFRFTNGATCVIAQNLEVTNLVVGRYGDESARLVVGDTLRARALLLDHVTLTDASEIDAIICTVEGWGLPIDIDYYADNRHVFDANVLRDGGRIDIESAWDAASHGAPVLLEDAEARLGAIAGARHRARTSSP